MTYEKFEELPSWQVAARLYNRVLDILEEHGGLFTSGFRGQIDRAALSVSNNIAEGFERTTTRELVNFLGFARGSAGEVRSMIAVVKARTRLQVVRGLLEEIAALADECVRQIAGWVRYLEESEVQGKRHLTPERRREKQAGEAARKYRLQFLLGLKPDHPLYNSPEAQAARGEAETD